jgi:multidrug efflux pump subunit AcrA (membrane-fusion protein)
MDANQHMLPPAPERKALPPPVHRIHPWLVGLIAAFVLLVILLIAFIPRNKQQKVVDAAAQREANTIPSANVVKVKRSAAVSNLLLPGDITPLTEAYIYARATGYVRRRYADIGDHVREGQVLADVDAPDLDAQVLQARAMLSQAEQQLAQAKAALENAAAQEDLAHVTWQRYQVLVTHGAVSRQDADQQLANDRQAQANVHLQEASVRTSEENVRANRANLEHEIALQDFEHVRAPFSGVITSRNFDVGAYINAAGNTSGASTTPMGGTQSAAQLGTSGASGSSATPSAPPSSPSATGAPSAGSTGELFRIAQIGTVRILINVPQENAPTVQPGLPATVFVQQFSKQNFRGKVTRTTNSLDQTTRTLLTEVQLANPQLLLLPGMYAQVQFSDTRPSPPLLLPGDSVVITSNGLEVAVLQDLTEHDRQQLEERAKSSKETPPSQQIDQARRIHLQKVEVGRDYGTDIEISAGLQGWEYVVASPGDNIQEGAIILPTAAPAVEGQGGGQPSQSDRQPQTIGSPSMAAPTQTPPAKGQKKGGDQKGGQGEKK